MFKPGTILNQRYKILRQVGRGGFSLIFEVRDIRQFNLENYFGLRKSKSIRILKVFSYLGYQVNEAESCFRREIEILKLLNHPQIVQYKDNFEIIINNQNVPCLVLEKINGKTLSEWINDHGSISEFLAINWLSQCIKILDYLHCRKYIMHLDLKPENILITSSGKLVILDFGTARIFTTTLISKLVDLEGEQFNRIGTPFYSPVEQTKGKPIPQSDYYSLGKVIIQALINKYHDQIQEDEEGFLLWHQYASEVTEEFKSVLDWMISYEFQARPQNPREIEYSILQLKEKLNIKDKKLLHSILELSFSFTLYSTLTSILVLILRTIGFFQVPELAIYDFMLRIRPLEESDKRILIIEITESDLIYQSNNFNSSIEEQWRGSLADQFLDKILQKLSLYNPAVVGVDIYRETSISKNLVSNLIAVCGTQDDAGVPLPPEHSIGHTGFATVPLDVDYRSRRQYITREINPICPTDRSFSYVIADSYLKTINSSALEEALQEEDFSYFLSRSLSHSSIYPRHEIYDLQTMINFRSLRSFRDISESITLADFLEEPPSAELHEMIHQKIVLIGTTAPSYKDYKLTPYGEQAGLFINAHIVSDLISFALNERPLIKVLKLRGSLIWIWSWTILSVALISTRRSVKRAISLFFLISSIHILICFCAILIGYLVPLFPVFISISFSAIISIYLIRHKKTEG
ncbi:CHASE2 domain-containing protein [Leptolyngbya sp. CCNP1308]|uniref:CHASE2 domain-containing protein n=1 Tax=Leptolyngbya sp. CCNP1308 TaxID=3110255 RepID=UPI002B1F7B9E|nr:CHASE2 domain-containing protein [Leptolyngbya sp. CCNP1308]MEA5451838.1 CHASE2 domain-containing protein [Leptolyngbya sp. CCNP1308]